MPSLVDALSFCIMYVVGVPINKGESRVLVNMVVIIVVW
jgi:hypothetical protein